MKSIGLNEQQLQKMKSHPGFIAALDQSGGSTPKALALYGIKEGAWSNEEEMFAIVHRDAHPHDYQPMPLTGSGSSAPSFSRTRWTGISTGNLRLTISGT